MTKDDKTIGKILVKSADKTTVIRNIQLWAEDMKIMDTEEFKSLGLL